MMPWLHWGVTLYNYGIVTPQWGSITLLYAGWIESGNCISFSASTIAAPCHLAELIKREKFLPLHSYILYISKLSSVWPLKKIKNKTTIRSYKTRPPLGEISLWVSKQTMLKSSVGTIACLYRILGGCFLMSWVRRKSVQGDRLSFDGGFREI